MMKNTFKLYAIVWSAILALFNVISFVIPSERNVSFWIGYGFISLALIGHIVVTYVIFKNDSTDRVFYNLSLFRVNYIALVASFVVGGTCMALAFLPYWVGIIACALVLVAHILSVLKSAVAIAEIERVDKKVKATTEFIKSLTTDADVLLTYASTDVAKAACKKVYDAVRYSDPVSTNALEKVEGEISKKFLELSSAVKSNDERVGEIANELVLLVSERNKRCKASK